MEEEIGDSGSEHVVINLSAEQMEALTLLYTDPEINRKLAGIAFKSRRDKDDLRQELALKLSTNGYKLRDFNSLTSWCCVSAKNICKNAGRHDKVVKRHRESCAGESVQSRRSGGAVVVLRSEVKTPEEQMLEREKAAQLHAVLDGIVSSLPKDMQEIARLWDERKSPAEIAKLVKKSLATVYRKHKEFERIIVEKVGDLTAAAE